MGTDALGAAWPLGPLKISVGVPWTPMVCALVSSLVTWAARFGLLRSDCHVARFSPVTWSARPVR